MRRVQCGAGGELRHHAERRGHARKHNGGGGSGGRGRCAHQGGRNGGNHANRAQIDRPSSTSTSTSTSTAESKGGSETKRRRSLGIHRRRLKQGRAAAAGSGQDATALHLLSNARSNLGLRVLCVENSGMRIMLNIIVASRI
jgi:hypothetical protein